MLDRAGIFMEQGNKIACERIAGINDNMKKSHSHTFFEIYYLENGARFHVIEDKVYPLKPGQIAIFAPNIIHRSYGDVNVNFKRIVLYFDESQINSIDIRNALLKSSGVYTMDNKSRYIIHEILDILAKKSYNSCNFKNDYLNSMLNF